MKNGLKPPQITIL